MSKEVDVLNNTHFKTHIWRIMRLRNKLNGFPQRKMENHWIPYSSLKNSVKQETEI